MVSVMDGVIYINVKETVYHGSLESSNFNVGMYLDECETMYALNPDATGVKSISRKKVNRMNVNVTAVNQGNSLDIHIAEPEQGENVVVSSMSGQVINQTPLGNAEHISIGTGSYSKGVYNVTLHGNSDTENARIIIK